MTQPKILMPILLETNGELGVVDVESSKETRGDEGEEVGEGCVEGGGGGEGGGEGGGMEMTYGMG